MYLVTKTTCRQGRHILAPMTRKNKNVVQHCCGLPRIGEGIWWSAHGCGGAGPGLIPATPCLQPPPARGSQVSQERKGGASVPEKCCSMRASVWIEKEGKRIFTSSGPSVSSREPYLWAVHETTIDPIGFCQRFRFRLMVYSNVSIYFKGTRVE